MRRRARGKTEETESDEANDHIWRSSDRHTRSDEEYGQTEVLHEIDLAVPEGAIYALVGPNGAGKTTMIKLLMNILRPTSGSARVLGLGTHELAGEVFNRIAYVSENQEMPEAMTVMAMLEYMRPFYPRWAGSWSGNWCGSSICQLSAS